MLAWAETETQRQWWTCERCHARLGEVVGEAVIIAHGYRTWVVPLSIDGITARCKCGQENEIQAGFDEARVVT